MAPFRMSVVMLVAASALLACGPGAAPPPATVEGPSAPSTSAPPPLQRIRMTYPSEGMCCLPLFAARDRGFFERNGLEVETLLMTSDRAMAAVASGELHYVGGVGTASVAAAALGLPLRAVWISASSPAYTIFARPEIRTLEQLKGKRVGIPGFGGTSALAMRGSPRWSTSRPWSRCRSAA